MPTAERSEVFIGAVFFAFLPVSAGFNLWNATAGFAHGHRARCLRTATKSLRTATDVAGRGFGGRSKARSGVKRIEPDGVRQKSQAAVCENSAKAQVRVPLPLFSTVAGANCSQSAALAV